MYKIYGIRSIIPFLLGKKEKTTIVAYFPFSEANSLEEWSDKVLHKKVSYGIESSGSESYVHAASKGSCSAKYKKIKLDASKRPILSWKWRVAAFPAKKFPDDLSNKEEDDFAARLYIIFPTLFLAKSKIIEYIWVRDLKIGTISSSPYSDNIKLIAVESGLKEEGKWVFEERNIYEDYVSAFKEKPKRKIGAIAFMCDSDSTNSSAEAYFDEIKISIKD